MNQKIFTLLSEKLDHGAVMGEVVMSSAIGLLTAPSHLSIQEVRDKLRSLTEPEWARLQRRSRELAYDHRILPGDLQQEAFVRVLDGRRRCDRAFDIVDTLVGVMKSLVSAERKNRRAATTGQLDTARHDAADDAPLPDRTVVDGGYHRQTLAMIRHELEDDPPLVRLLESVLVGMEGDAIKTHLGINTQQLATLRRRLKRKIAAATEGRERP